MSVAQEKAVLLSVNPEWCELIVDAKKTVEVRRTAPRNFYCEHFAKDAEKRGDAFRPFKCYIYCTVGKARTRSIQPDHAVFFGDGKDLSNGKVIGEFICDEIVPIKVFEDGAIQNWNFYELNRACVPYDDLASYVGAGRHGYGWHISNLTIYAQPKALGEFTQRAPMSWCYVDGKE